MDMPAFCAFWDWTVGLGLDWGMAGLAGQMVGRLDGRIRGRLHNSICTYA